MTNRRSPLLIVLSVLLLAVLPATALPAPPASIELYSLFELALAGPTDTPTFNAFVSVSLNATFTHTGGVSTASTASAASAAASAATTVRGFYDGAGRYVVRFMPSAVGTYSYATSSNSAAITDTHGTFQVTPIKPSTGSSSSYRGRQDPRNHGPARTSSQGYGFAYDDGTAYIPVGTTSYAWLHQPEGDALEELTLKSLAASPFNKIRMTIFPKYYPFTHDEPRWCKCQRGEALCVGVCVCVCV